MRLVTYSYSGGERLGLAMADSVLDLNAAHEITQTGPSPLLCDMLTFIEAGDPALEIANELQLKAPPEALLKLNDVRMRAPLPIPAQVRDFMCFEKHVEQAFRAAAEMQAAESGKPARETRVPAVWYQRPVYYKANRFAVSGPEDTIQWPSYSQLMDYELEIAAIIGRKGCNIAKADAPDHVFGYTIFNDFSARDAQSAEMGARLGPAKGKDFDGANAFGPCIVTADEIEDVYSLEMRARVNGEEWSRGTTADMRWKFDDLIAYVSQSETLYPGEILGSGTVGNGCGLEHRRFLSDGDIVELDIEGIGVLRNTVVRS